MLRRLAVAAALCALAAVVPAHAMGLGDIKVKSGLNQRFSAVIPFTSLSPDEAANIRARLAENQDFARAGLDRSAYLSTIRVEAVTDGPNPHVELSSGEIAREPLLTLLIEIRKPGGTRMLREYTVLLDPAVTPASMGSPSGSQSASGGDSDFFQTPDEARGVRPTGPRASTPASGGGTASVSSASRIGADGLYGPVGPRETLWMIAQAVKPADVGLDQAMLALYEANPDAFTGNDIDYLRKGSRLRIPAIEQMQAMSNPAARARVLELSSQGAAAPGASSPVSSSARISSASSFPPTEPLPAPTKPYEPPATSVPPPSMPDTSPVPSTSGTATTPVTPPGTTPAEAATSVATTPTPGTPEPAAASDGQQQPTPPPAAQEESVGSWITNLLPFLILLILVLVGIATWRSARERKAKREYDQASRETGGIPAPRMGATGSFGAKGGAAASARAELEELGRQMDDDATRIAPTDDDPDRTRMVITSKIPVYTGPQAADRKMDEAELAVTSQFQANTKEIKLGDNDPLSEADFHLAYGLYDEAALLLQQASARAPRRTDLRVKLAETYFGAGKAAEFEQTAGTLKGEISGDEWNKIAIMGRQLAPTSGLFAGNEGSNSDIVLDLTFDDDATQISPVKVDEGLSFNLEELELPTKTDRLAGQADQALEFDLGEFDLGGDKPKKSASPSSPSHAMLDLQDFDLGGSDLAGPGKGDLDVRLDEVEPMVIDDPMGDEPLPAGNDASTKLDLARAYVEMGDAEMARSLLEEVAKSGTDDQKREAGELRERLLG